MEWVCLALGLTLTLVYSWIMDDAYVYYRYVDNLLFMGDGLVYNKGEYVEGFSSPAWALMLIGFRALHLNYWFIIKFAAICSFVVFWALMVIVNRRLCDDLDKPYIVNFPLIHTSLTYGVLCYFTSGLESPVVLIAAAAYACFFLHPQSRALQAVIGVSPLIRPELALPFVIALGWVVATQKRVPVTSLVASVFAVGGWTVFRVYYYAELLPNTYYLKDLRSVSQGLSYLYDTGIAYFTLHIILALLACWFFFARQEDRYAKARLAMLIVAASVTIYVVKVGGDARHFRYLAFPYCLMMAAGGGLVERALVRSGLHQRPRSVLAMSLIVALFTVTCYPRQLSDHPITQRMDLAFPEHDGARIRTFMNINDASNHRLHPTMTPEFWSDGGEMADMREKMEAFARSPASRRRVIATFWCTVAYDQFDRMIVHSLGLTEPFLARMNAPPTQNDRTAHKWALQDFAKQIVKLRKKHGFEKGAFRRAAEAGRAKPWMVENLEVIEAIESKIYNTHDFWENAGLALKSVGRIDPD